MNNFYVYIYLDPRKPGNFKYNEYEFDYEPFYVGKGKNIRYKLHLKCKDNSYKTNKIKAVLSENLEPIILKIKENLLECQAFKIEMELIKTIGRFDLGTGPLTNLTNGGDGSCGYIISKETKLKMSKIAIIGFKNGIRNINGKNNGMFGKLFTKEQKEKRSKILSGKGNPFYGKHHSEETKLKIGLKTIERCKNKKYIKKLSKIHKGNKLSENAKQKLSSYFKDMIFINKNGICKRIKKNNIQEYLNNGWKLSRK